MTKLRRTKRRRTVFTTCVSLIAASTFVVLAATASTASAATSHAAHTTTATTATQFPTELRLSQSPARSTATQFPTELRLSQSPARSSAQPGPTQYWYGQLIVCAQMDSKGNCNPSKWWVVDYFQFTTDGLQTWNNGTPSCSANHTNITWCSYVFNGTSSFSEGVNFGNNGWARMDVPGTYGYCEVRSASYADRLGDMSPDTNLKAIYTCLGGKV
jgi:hypothetical protein